MTEMMSPQDFEGVLPQTEVGHKVLTFTLGRESFALPIDRIKEIIEFAGITRVPLAPRYIRGVINLRGSVVPVIDLGERLGRPGGPQSRRTCIVVVEVTEGDEVLDIGVVVDSVTEVLDIDAGDIEPAPAFGTTVPSEFISGMGRVKGRFVVILDQAQVLSVEELSQFDA